MGVLDDAIKEHLDLKRRQGASEDDLRKQEAEALGPGRREPVAEPEDEDLEPLAEADVELPLGEPPLEDEPPEEIDPVREPDAADEPTPVPVEQPDPDEVPREESLEAPRQPPAADANEDSEDSEDVLEDTPEFLQETPEHDRLWFEQKPPRDFDFDE